MSLSFAGPCELWLWDAGRQLSYVLAMTLEFWTPTASGTHLPFPKQKATHEVISPAGVDRARQVCRQLCRGRPYQTGDFSSVIAAVLMVHLQIAAALNEEMAI